MEKKMAQNQFILTNGKGEKLAILDFLIMKNVIKYLYLKYLINLIYAYKPIIYIYYICMSMFYRHKYTCMLLGTNLVFLNRDKYKSTYYPGIH